MSEQKIYGTYSVNEEGGLITISKHGDARKISVYRPDWDAHDMLSEAEKAEYLYEETIEHALAAS